MNRFKPVFSLLVVISMKASSAPVSGRMMDRSRHSR